jgi:hypothetical protein
MLPSHALFPTLTLVAGLSSAGCAAPTRASSTPAAASPGTHLRLPTSEAPRPTSALRPITPAAPAAPAAPIGRAGDAGPPDNAAPVAPTTGHHWQPRVRPVKWVCRDWECESRPSLAYEGLPAVSQDGAIVAFVEERDGWGHVKQAGIRLVARDGATTFLPTTARPTTESFEAYAAHRAEHQGVVDDANRVLATAQYRALLPVSLGEGARASATVAGVRVTFVFPDEAAAQGGFMNRPGPLFTELTIEAGGPIVRRSGTDFPDEAGCSARRLVVDGIDPAARVLAFTFTNGLTQHNCDGRPEPQVHHVVRW